MLERRQQDLAHRLAGETQIEAQATDLQRVGQGRPVRGQLEASTQLVEVLASQIAPRWGRGRLPHRASGRRPWPAGSVDLVDRVEQEVVLHIGVALSFGGSKAVFSA